jgi:hypothetical protein
MLASGTWFEILVDLLASTMDDEAVWSALSGARPALERATVQLLEGPMTAREVVTYARTLMELGMTGPAMELVSLLAYGPVDVPQGDQLRAVMVLGGQGEA